MRSPDGVVIERGKFTEVWTRTPAGWQIASDTWNSDGGSVEADTWIITHEVADGDHWLAAWQGEPSRRESSAEHGAPSVRLFRSPDDPDSVGLVVDVADAQAFNGYLASPEGAEAKAADGVIDGTIRILAEVE